MIKVFLKRPALYHFEKTVLKPGVNEITKEIFEKMKRNPMVLRDFERGVLEEVSPQEEPPLVEQKPKARKRKKAKVERQVEASLESDDSK